MEQQIYKFGGIQLDTLSCMGQVGRIRDLILDHINCLQNIKYKNVK